MKLKLLIFILSWPLLAISSNDLNETRLQILREIEVLYKPLIERQGGQFQIEILQDGLLSGSASRAGNQWRVHLSEGLLQAQRLSDDGFSLLICHELGHLLGGEPRRPAPMDWEGETDGQGHLLLSAEGQADYDSTRTCIRKVLKVQNDKGLRARPEIDPLVREKCRLKFQSQVDREICERSAMAGLSFLQLVKDFPISFQTPSQTVVSETNVDSYPDRQCRLDTIFAGALDEPRPRCWFLNR